MANDLTKSIKYVTDAATIYSTSVPLGKIVWTHQVAGGDTLLLKDVDDVVLFSAKSSAANDYIEFDFNGAPHSLVVTTITTGSVLIIHPYLP